MTNADILKYNPYVFRAVGKYFRKWEREDKIQIAREAVMNTLLAYPNASEQHKRQLVYKSIKHIFCFHIEAQMSQKRNGLVDDINEANERKITRLRCYIPVEAIENSILLNNLCTRKEAKAVQMWIEGYGSREIEKKYKLRFNEFWSIIRRMRSNLVNLNEYGVSKRVWKNQYTSKR